jgi:NAD(P)-dependent dehydrogenase (short-subunit alcohol dehydrogenase family)/acyl carrier protein
MDKLTSARTLKELIERLSAVLGSAPAPAALTEPRPLGSGPSANDLLTIAAERTGYPADMLDLNAGIESDLGIDSIKRVEILSEFQKRCSPDQQVGIQGVMDKLTSARTLKEIIERLSAAAGSAPAAAPAATPAPVRQTSTHFDAQQQLLAIAAERTGYPADMLDLNAGIESDLGIDSIKRVEILSEFQKRCSPDQQVGIQGVMDKLTSARTLREVIDRITEAVKPAVPAIEEAPALPRFRMAAVDRPLQKTNPLRYVPGRICLISDDETGLAAGLAEEHQRGGEKVILLRHAPGGRVIEAEGVISGDLTDAAAINEIVAKVRAQHGPIGAILHLLPLRAGNGLIEDSLSRWRDHVRQDVRSLYALARASEADLKQSGHGLVAVVTARGGTFGYEPTASMAPTHHGIADFVKTLALEFNGVQCKVIDIDPTDPQVILRRKIADEIASGDETLQVGLPGDRRLTALPEHAPVNGGPVRAITKDWVVLLTGGARGITAAVAQKMAERYQPTLILAGASPLPSDEPAEYASITDRAALKTAVMQKMKAGGGPVKPAEVEAAFQRLMKDREIRQTVADLRQAGSRVEYHSIDVRDEAAMKSLLEGIYAKHGRLDAVIHGAGIIEDKLLKDKTPESFDRVVHTKTDSSWLLSRLLKPESLQCLVFMSSITAAFGNRAQADYAIANGVMNGYALKLSAEWAGRVVAMNWGPWDQQGMVTDEVRRQFLSRGIHMIPIDDGVEAVLREIERGHASDAVVAFGAGPWGDIALPDGTARNKSRTLGAAV